MIRKHTLKDIKTDFKFMRFSKDVPFKYLTDKDKGLIQSLLNLTNYSKPKTAKGSRLEAFYNSLRK